MFVDLVRNPPWRGIDLTNSKPLKVFCQHLPNKEIARDPTSGASAISLAMACNNELDAHFPHGRTNVRNLTRILAELDILLLHAP